MLMFYKPITFSILNGEYTYAYHLIILSMYVSLPCSWQGRIIINFSGNTRGYKACRELWWGFELYIKFETHHPLIMLVSQIPSLLLTKEHLLRWLESNSEVKCAYLCAYLQILI